ncbi:MAG: VWA domain-containing protein [Polyangiaceae bacterium]|nr:VWA domain-containing protein [Polyangiaceae bacterium]
MANLIDKIGGVPMPTMTLFLALDTSGSMEGEKVGALNAALDEVVPELKDMSASAADARIKIAALQFSNGAEWLTPGGPIEAEQYHWSHVTADGLTDFGEACKELNAKLSTRAFMKETTSCYAPVIILMSDGVPTDDWTRPLADLKQNKWFKAAIKIALAIGKDADKNVLREFTGNPEAVVEVHNKAMLRKMIRFVTVRASAVASTSSNVGAATTDEDKQVEMNEAIADYVAEFAAAPGHSDDIDW